MSNNQLLYVKFFLRNTKRNPEKGMLYLRISVNNKRIDSSFNHLVSFNSWDPIKEIVNASDENYLQINLAIKSAKTRIQSIYEKLRYENQLITSHIIKNHFIGNIDDGQTLLGLIEYHNTSQTEKLSPGTLKNYYTTKKHIDRFLKAKMKADDINLKQLNYRFITEFESYLRKSKPTDHQRPLSNNGVMKHLERLRKITTMAVKLEWLEKDPFERYRLSFNKTERCYLTELEIETLKSKQFGTERLQLVKDLFIFSCYTGLAYIDLSMLKPENITLGIDGEIWLSTTRKKTNVSVNIPLLPDALMILNKYKSNPRCIQSNRVFPKISNQNLNNYLKEIAEICQINKKLTFHIARHTFATTITLSNGVPIETISKILGHTKISTTMIYAKVLKQKISSDMLDLKGKLYSKTSKDDDIRHAK